MTFVPPIPDARAFPWERALFAGVLSGTSADGIDVVLARARVEVGPVGFPRLAGLEARAFATEPFEAEIARRVRRVLDGVSPSLAEVAALDHDLGRAFGRAARAVADRHGVGELCLVASHGQTVFHHDGLTGGERTTIQWGDGDEVAEAAGVPAVSDFRRRDCASGGEGAPLVALVDDVLFSGAPRPLAVLNLGGMANWTVLTEGGRLGFDTGPAGAVLDGLARNRLGRPYDDGGRVAAGGTVDRTLVEKWMGHPFFSRTGPRSTGRDTFGEEFVASVLADGEGLADADLLATAAAFVAEAAARALLDLADLSPGALHVALAGGGAHHARLVRELEERLPAASFGTTDDHGVPVDAREALAFAALGVRHAIGEPSTDPAVSGAAPGRVLGKWTPAARDLHPGP